MRWGSLFRWGFQSCHLWARWGYINVLVGVCLFSTAVSDNVTPQNTTDTSPITIAVIDTGIDVRHSFISDNIWKNPGESGLDDLGRPKESNGIDDDQNGFVDDVYGWNFAHNSSDVRDTDGHGTHIAGSIKQTIYRENPYAPFKLMALKYFGSKKGVNHKEAFIRSLKYAIDAGVQIINISGGGSHFEEREFTLLKKAMDKGILVVAAAGNKSIGRGFDNFFPAAYDLPNVISVAATDAAGALLATSNVNETRTNAFMPGYRIHSTLPQNQFGFKTGSSQAAAIYTGHYVATVAMKAFQLRR